MHMCVYIYIFCEKINHLKLYPDKANVENLTLSV